MWTNENVSLFSLMAPVTEIQGKVVTAQLSKKERSTKQSPEVSQPLLTIGWNEIKGCMKEVLSSFVPAQPATDTLPLTMTVPQFCKQMNVSRSVAYDMINSAGFPAFRVGAKYLINSRALQQWINQQSHWGENE